MIEKVTAIFLTPPSILIGALGVARTEGLKTGISAIGMLSVWLWLKSHLCIRDLYAGFDAIAGH